MSQNVNQQVKALIQKLGEAIHESVSDSEHIADVVREIRDQGFEVMLMLEATIGLNEIDSDTEDRSPRLLTDGGAPTSFTQNDLTFLKSLRIALDEKD